MKKFLHLFVIICALLSSTQLVQASELPEATVGVCQDNKLLDSLTANVKASHDTILMQDYVRFLRKCENLLQPKNLEK